MNTNPAQTDSISPLQAERRRSGRWLILMVALVGTGLVLAYLWVRNQHRDELRYERGRQALLDGDFEIARVESEKLIATPGFETYGLLLRGQQRALAKRFREAVEDLQKASANPALTVESLTLVARCYYQSGQYLQAIDSAMQALQKDAGAVDARRWLASAYYDLGANSHAAAELGRLSDEAPDDPRPDRLLGLIAKDSEQYALAIQHYQKSLLRHPADQQQVMLELAESQMKLGRFAEALESSRRCDRTAEALTIAGNCQVGLGHFPQAEAELRDALRLNERYVPAMLALGNLALDQGNLDEAVSVLEGATKIEPQNRQVHFQLSQALRSKGQIDRADAELKQVQELQAVEVEFSSLHIEATKSPADARVRSRLGELALQLHKPELALLWFRAALALDPNDRLSRGAIIQLQQAQPGLSRMR